MHPMAARAFLAIQMSHPNREILRAHERILPAGRYMTGSEICQWLRRNPRIPEVRNPSDNESTAMQTLWAEYCHEHLNPGRAFEEQHPELETLSLAREIHAWEDWAIRKFQGAKSMALVLG